MELHARHITLCATSDLVTDQRMMRICASLHEANFSVTLIGRTLPNSLPLLPQPYHQYRLSCYFHKGKLFYIEFAIRLFFRLLYIKIDIINAVDLDTILPVLLASKIRNKRCTYDAHEYFTEVPEVVNRPLTKHVWERVAAFCIPKMDACYTVGEALAKVFSERYKVPFGTVRNMATLKNIDLENDYLEPKIILYQGVLNEGRGLENLILSMQHIENAVLWIVGDGDISTQLRDLVIENTLQKKVIFLGKKRPSELQAITEQSYIGINILEPNGLSYYYSLANKTFDYIQAAKPAIHIQFPEYEALNERYNIGILVKSTAPEILCAAIQRLLTDEQLYTKLADNCRRAAKELCWENEKNTLLNIYNAV